MDSPDGDIDLEVAFTMASDINIPTPMAPIGKPDMEYDEYSVVTVLHGWGRVRSTEVKWLDNIKFVGGVATHVPYEIARKWQKLPQMGQHIFILPDDATEADYARKTGIQPMSLPKFAAMLSSMNLDDLVMELGPTRTAELAEQLRSMAAPKVTRAQDGKWRSNTKDQ